MKDLPPTSSTSSWLGRRRVPIFLGTLVLIYHLYFTNFPSAIDAEQVLARCKALEVPAGPPTSYNSSIRIEKGSERYVAGSVPVLIRNSKIWTGADNGTEVIFGDILLDKGVIVALGRIHRDVIVQAKANKNGFKTFDARGRWVTPGLVDLHSHIGVDSAPHLEGTDDTNSRKAPILPWLRSIDGINTHDAAYELVVGGGVTTVQVLPGSANNIGGQAFLIKLRPTKERSVISKVLEPPQTLFTNQTLDHLPWRHMKHACASSICLFVQGENPSRVHSQSRMDSSWNFREAYDTAQKLKNSQDAYCRRVKHGHKKSRWPWSLRKRIAAAGDFPEDLKWEALVDVLRGRVKLSVHCYEAVDLDAMVRLSNEFQFPIASFHHAGDTYLVPELLKKTWGGAPSIALFASNARKKREAYRSSEFAPKLLAEQGISVVMKSDHPVLNSRYLLYEAQQAHYYGLDANLALASVTSTPATAAGVGHRVGKVAMGYDADIAVWDSHPLALGATPVQVYIDGIAQLVEPEILSKSSTLQHAPETPNWDVEAQRTVQFDGVPPLRGRKIRWGGWRQNGDISSSDLSTGVKFIGVKSVYIQNDDGEVSVLFDEEANSSYSQHPVIVDDNGIVSCAETSFYGCKDERMPIVDLKGGSLAPGLTTFGTDIGLSEILLEPSTADGLVKDPLAGSIPSIVGGDSAVIRAVDGLQFEGRNSLLAYRAGVTRAVAAPMADGFLSGLSATFDLGAANAMEKGAIIKEETALHVSISMSSGISVSTQIAALRKLLYESASDIWERVRTGALPLVIQVDSADIMATLLRLKTEYEHSSRRSLRIVFAGAAEAHLLAAELGASGVSVILTSPRPYPGSWEKRRFLPGPPLSRDSTLTALLAKGVDVAIGTVNGFNAHNTRFDLAWAALESNGTISKLKAVQLATTHLNRALGVIAVPDIVAYRSGNLFDLESKVAGVVSIQRKTFEIF